MYCITDQYYSREKRLRIHVHAAETAADTAGPSSAAETAGPSFASLIARSEPSEKRRHRRRSPAAWLQPGRARKSKTAEDFLTADGGEAFTDDDEADLSPKYRKGGCDTIPRLALADIDTSQNALALLPSVPAETASRLKQQVPAETASRLKQLTQTSSSTDHHGVWSVIFASVLLYLILNDGVPTLGDTQQRRLDIINGLLARFYHTNIGITARLDKLTMADIRSGGARDWCDLGGPTVKGSKYKTSYAFFRNSC